MENYTDDELKEELGRRGYCTTALWHIDDVRTAIEKNNLTYRADHDMNDAECMQILDGMFGANADLSADLDTLEYAVFEHLQDRLETSRESHPRGR